MALLDRGRTIAAVEGLLHLFGPCSRQISRRLSRCCGNGGSGPGPAHRGSCRSTPAPGPRSPQLARRRCRNHWSRCPDVPHLGPCRSAPARGPRWPKLARCDRRTGPEPAHRYQADQPHHGGRQGTRSSAGDVHSIGGEAEVGYVASGIGRNQSGKNSIPCFHHSSLRPKHCALIRESCIG